MRMEHRGIENFNSRVRTALSLFLFFQHEVEESFMLNSKCTVTSGIEWYEVHIGGKRAAVKIRD